MNYKNERLLELKKKMEDNFLIGKQLYFLNPKIPNHEKIFKKLF